MVKGSTPRIAIFMAIVLYVRLVKRNHSKRGNKLVILIGFEPYFALLSNS